MEPTFFLIISAFTFSLFAFSLICYCVLKLNQVTV